MKQKQHGFTIIELMIASVVFSMLLILLTSVIIQIGRQYNKGVISSKTQEVARSIMEQVSQSIQFGGAIDITNPREMCFGGYRFTSVLGKQITDSASPTATQTAHALVADQPASCHAGNVSLTTATLGAGASELVGPNMRLAKFEVSRVGTTDLYNVSVRVVYGDDDLLCSPGTTGDCASNATTADFTASDLNCKAFKVGGQFCAASELNTTVQKRVN